MSSTDLVSSLRAEVERLRARVQLLEGVARVNGETIRSVQRAAAETTTEAIRAERTNNREPHAPKQSPPDNVVALPVSPGKPRFVVTG